MTEKETCKSNENSKGIRKNFPGRAIEINSN